MNFVFDNDRPIYIQLVEQVQMYIVSGKIESGERLPSVRDLALRLKVNPNTMQKALLELENRKLIYTERTNGKFVTHDKLRIKKYKEQYAKEKTNKYVLEMLDLGIDREEIITYIKKESDPLR